MAAIIKTAEEIEKMRVAGRLAAEVLTMIGDYVKKGVTNRSVRRSTTLFVTVSLPTKN